MLQMMALRRHSFMFAAAMFAFAGCTYSPPQEKVREDAEPGYLKTKLASKPKSNGSVNADIEISVAAKNRVANGTGKVQGNRLRLEFTPGGCTGMKTHLSLQADDLGPQDAAQDCGGCECVFPSDQLALAQGALIDWKEKERGFSVTFPNKTRENQVKTTKWINDE